MNKPALIILAAFSLLTVSCRSVCQPSAKLTVGDSFYSEVFEICGTEATASVLTNSHREKKTKVAHSLSAIDVAEFWAVLDRELVDQWKAHYQSEVFGERTAYTSWNLEVNREGMLTESYGDAAFPADSSPTATSSLVASERFQRVYEAFKRICR